MLHFIWVFTVCKRTCLGISLIQRVNGQILGKAIWKSVLTELRLKSPSQQYFSHVGTPPRERESVKKG